jgi:hypothetical protein
VAICVFAKTSQKDASKKVEEAGINWQALQVVTSHSLGFDNDKVKKLIRAENDLDYQQFYGAISDMVHLAKVEGFGFFDDCQIGEASPIAPDVISGLGWPYSQGAAWKLGLGGDEDVPIPVLAKAAGII